MFSRMSPTSRRNGWRQRASPRWYWINDEIKSLGEESFFHKDYEETLVDTYGLDYEDELVVEGGETNA